MNNEQKATFAAGCFWGVEDKFHKTMGVLLAVSGYTGGHTKNPSYEAVCSDTTGHAEAVEVTYDSDKISYPELLNVFWNMHNPTQINRQGPDTGSRYRSAIFYHTPEQKIAAEKSKQALSQSGKYDRPLATEITPAGEFYPAEEYHQRYFEKHPDTAACHV